MVMTNSVPRPPSITIIGWSTVLASAIMIVVNVVSVLSYSMLGSGDLNLSTPLLSQYIPESMRRVLDLYRYSHWWTWYGIFFFCFVLIAAVQFLRLKAWGRTAFEVACWIGLFNGVVDTALSYWIWKDVQESLSLVLRGLGGGQYSSINPLGLFAIVVGFLLWIIPSIGIIVYLRKPAIRQAASLR
jgi:hypothetical protein